MSNLQFQQEEPKKTLRPSVEHIEDPTGLHPITESDSAQSGLAASEKQVDTSQNRLQDEASLNNYRHQIDIRDITSLQIIDAKIAATTDIEVLKELVVQRGIMIKQNLAPQNYWKLAEKFILAPAIIGAGMWLLFHPFVYIGGMMIGAGLWIVAPEFVMEYLKKLKDKDKSSSDDKDNAS